MDRTPYLQANPKCCIVQAGAASHGDGQPMEPPPAAPPPVPAGAPPAMPPPMFDPLRGGITGGDFARFDGELDSEMGRQFEVWCSFPDPSKPQS